MSSNLHSNIGTELGQDAVEAPAVGGACRVSLCGGIVQHEAPVSTAGASSLGNVHISARASDAVAFPERRAWGARAVFMPGGVHAAAPGRRKAPPAGVHQRGAISGFSVSSRRRLRLALMEVAWDSCDSYWVTLTYHREWAEDWQGWKRDLRTFHKALDRRYPTVGDFWRLEFQRRGAPHFHLVLAYGLGLGPRQDEFRAWIARTWARIIGEEGNKAHLSFGTCTVRVDRHGKEHLGALLGYLVKEVCKVKQAQGARCGRHWGRRGELPTRRLAEVELTDEGYWELASRLASVGVGWLADNLSGAWPGFVVLGSGESLLDWVLEDLPGGVRFVGGSRAPGGG